MATIGGSITISLWAYFLDQSYILSSPRTYLSWNTDTLKICDA